ncbi:hypothetical protein D3C79_1072050 [compost metagenome]
MVHAQPRLCQQLADQIVHQMQFSHHAPVVIVAFFPCALKIAATLSVRLLVHLAGRYPSTVHVL